MTPPGPARDAAGVPELLDIVRGEIRRDGTISFARFMDLALYEPRWGYYAGGAGRPGPAGDFVTASDSGCHFGRAVARQLVEIDRAIGRPERFDVVEFGAGRGLLARDVIDATAEVAPDLASRLRYHAVDRSPAMREAIRAAAPDCRVAAPDELGGERLVGAALAVELFDALPVERLRRRDGRLLEVRVGLGPADELVEVESPASPGLAALAERWGAAAEEGGEAELAPDLPAWFAAMHAPFERGVSVVVDYGDTAARLYGAGFPRGTLLAYHRHATNERFFERVGLQDLTAHVNFSALEACGHELGWRALGLVSQERFLVANGILEAFEAADDAAWHDPRHVKRRMQALQLIHPTGMGRAFRVLLLARGLDPAPRLAALAPPA